LLFGAGGLLLIVLLLGIAQLVLPGIAEQRLRDRLARSGTVLKVEVDAFPAIELLWHHADRVLIRMGTYRSSSAKLSSTLSQVGDVGSLDASATLLSAGLLTLHNASLHKRGSQLSGTATVTEADLRASIPVLDSVQPVASSGGQLTLQGTATLLGVTGSVDATVQPQNGALVVSPDVPFGGLATITLFDNPTIAVDGVAATPTPGGFALSAYARLR
jgi:LmeA-like phospholipid-binding